MPGLIFSCASSASINSMDVCMWGNHICQVSWLLYPKYISWSAESNLSLPHRCFITLLKTLSIYCCVFTCCRSAEIQYAFDGILIYASPLWPTSPFFSLQCHLVPICFPSGCCRAERYSETTRHALESFAFWIRQIVQSCNFSSWIVFPKISHSRHSEGLGWWVSLASDCGAFPWGISQNSWSRAVTSL